MLRGTWNRGAKRANAKDADAGKRPLFNERMAADAEARLALSTVRREAERDALDAEPGDALDRWSRVCGRLDALRRLTDCRHERRALASAYVHAGRAALMIALASGCATQPKPVVATACSVARVACGVVESACGAVGAGGEVEP